MPETDKSIVIAEINGIEKETVLAFLELIKMYTNCTYA